MVVNQRSPSGATASETAASPLYGYASTTPEGVARAKYWLPTSQAEPSCRATSRRGLVRLSRGTLKYRPSGVRVQTQVPAMNHKLPSGIDASDSTHMLDVSGVAN